MDKSQNSSSGKTYREHSAATAAKISEPSLKKSQKSKTPEYAYLDLTMAGGHTREKSWVTDIPSHTGCTMRSFGASPSELMGVITALEELKRPCEVDLFTDSQYITNAFNRGWIANWKKNGWRNSANKPVKNLELWQRLIAAARKHTVTWNWVKGHSGHPENERCDALAVAAAEQPSGELLHDDGKEMR